MPDDRDTTRRNAPTLTNDTFPPDSDNFGPDEPSIPSGDPAIRVAIAMLRRAIVAAPPCPAWCSIHVVTTPSSAWTQVLWDAWEEMARAAGLSEGESGAWWYRGCWSEFVRNSNPRRGLDTGNAEVATALAAGKLLVGFAPDASFLPHDLTDGADWHLVVTLPTPADILHGVPNSDGRDVNGIGLTTEEAEAVTPRLLRLATRSNQSNIDWFFKLRALLAREPRSAPKAVAAPRATPTLARLHGMPEATEWGVALSRDLNEFRRGALPWSAIDAGCLLSGPPGVGKTLFARALAATCGVPLFTGSYATWHSAGSAHQGDFLKAMRKTFADAKAAAPAILFIDEVDSFPDRTKLSGHNRSYETQVVNSLLAEIDGADTRDGVVLVAACNHPDRLDPALVRSGRLEWHIRLSLPNAVELAAILREHLGDDLRDENLGRIGLLAAERSGADCERLVRGARKRARARSEPMVVADLMAELVTPGMDAAADRRVATHEAGHVVAAIELGGSFVLEAVTMQAGNGASGGMLGRWTDVFLSGEQVRDRLVVLLAGRAAEEVMLGTASSGAGGGASSDLAQATGLALRASVSMGLDREDGLLWRGEPDERMAPGMLESDPRLAARIRLRLSEAHEQASELVRRRRGAVSALADALVECRTLSGDEARGIIRRHPGPECRA